MTAVVVSGIEKTCRLTVSWAGRRWNPEACASARVAAHEAGVPDQAAEMVQFGRTSTATYTWFEPVTAVGEEPPLALEDLPWE